MIEILWHGRGGQGAFTAARLLGAAASMPDGSFALAFPSFGPERRGAPMRAFTKVDKPIGDRSAVTRADYVVYLDDTLLDVTQQGWENELKDTARVLVNSTREYADSRIIAIDANGISERILGRPIPNTVFLGALAVLCPEIEADYVIQAVRQYMPAKLHAKNEQIIEETMQQMRLRQKRSEEASQSDTLSFEESQPVNVSRETPCEGTLNESSAPRAVVPNEAHGHCHDDVVRNCAYIPILRSHLAAPPSLDPAIYARTTCYQAGHLVAKNAGWRNERPVVDGAACTGCLQCYLYCPDGTVYKVSAAQGGGLEGSSPAASASEAVDHRRSSALVSIDYDFCKGCGICARVCKFNAITMVPESEAMRS